MTNTQLQTSIRSRRIRFAVGGLVLVVAACGSSKSPLEVGQSESSLSTTIAPFSSESAYMKVDGGLLCLHGAYDDQQEVFESTNGRTHTESIERFEMASPLFRHSENNLSISRKQLDRESPRFAEYLYSRDDGTPNLRVYIHRQGSGDWKVERLIVC